MAQNEDMASMNEAAKRSNTIHDELSKDKLLTKIEEARLAKVENSKPKIQRVPDILRDHPKSGKYYEPRSVALGPVHHNKARCQLAEKFKLVLAAKFIEESDCPAEHLHKIIEEKISTLKDYYDKEATSTYTDEALTGMFFLDGCSTLQFIYSFMNNKLSEFQIKRDQMAFAEQDLFLLENQLPYQVLKLLMSKSKKTVDLKNAIDGFVGRNIMPAQKKSRWHKHIRPTRPSIPADTAINKEDESGPSKPADTAINKEDESGPSKSADTAINMEDEPTHLLELLWKEMLGPQVEDACSSKKPNRKQSFRNIQELKAAGIRVRPSKRSTLQEISFTSLGFVGFLNLPKISVDDSMGPKFLNMIAYEMCPDFQNDFGVTSYIAFLESLIDSAEDVKELRSAGVLYNLLGSDEEVADLFNEIGTDLVPNSETYRSVKSKIEKHYKTKWKIWMAEFCYDHFRSPWTILAFLGVLLALGLSGVQTWYTISSPASPCDAVCDYLKKQLKLE